MSGRGKGADHLLHLSSVDQHANIYYVVVAAAVAVGDAGEVPGPLANEGEDEIPGVARSTETWEHDGGAVGDVRHGLIISGVYLALHGDGLPGTNLCTILPQTLAVRQLCDV